MSDDESDSDLVSVSTPGSPSPGPIQPKDRMDTINVDWATSMLADYYKYGEPKRPEIAASDILVKEVEFENQFDEGETALSDIYGLKISYRFSPDKSDHILQLIVKQLPQDPYSRLFVKEAQFDVREMKFYNTIVPDMKVFLKEYNSSEKEQSLFDSWLPIPKCYSPLATTDQDKNSRDIILVFENLKTQRYASPNFETGLTISQANCALDSIAKIHSLSLAMKIKYGDLNERYPFLFQTDRATDSYQSLLDRGLPQLGMFLEKEPHMTKVFRSILNMRLQTKDIISSLLSPKGPICLLTHIDFWCNNLLFQDTDKNCIILDWQMVTYSRPTNDVALLIVSSLPTEIRRNNTGILLDNYWEALLKYTSKLGVDVENTVGYTRQNLRKDYHKSQLLAVLLCIGSVDIALGNPVTENRLLDLLKDAYTLGLFSQDTIQLCLEDE